MQNYSFFSDVLMSFCIFACPTLLIKIMTEVKSKKPLLEAIQNGEQNIKVTAPKFLLECQEISKRHFGLKKRD